MKIGTIIAASVLFVACGSANAGSDQMTSSQNYKLLDFTQNDNLRSATILSQEVWKSVPPHLQGKMSARESFIHAEFNCDTKTVNILGEAGTAEKAATLNHRSDTVPVTMKHPYFTIMSQVCAG